ncbi:MAG TPA: hypothetical protein VI407_11210, partial [Erythrobacter sp.]
MTRPAALALSMLLPAAAFAAGAAAQESAAPLSHITVTGDRAAPVDELVLPPDHIITVTVDGLPIRLLVTAEASGPAAVNPQIAAQLGWVGTFRMLWDFGEGDPLRSDGLWRDVDFGGQLKAVPVMWSRNPASTVADGVIGIHHLPYRRVVFPLAEPSGE